MKIDQLSPVLNRLNPEEKDILVDLLERSTSSGEIDLSVLSDLYYADYDEVPVSIDQFISDPHYLGDVYDKGSLIYPYWRSFMHTAFHDNPNKAFEIGLTGAIGTGKSTVAAVMMTYMIYKTLCLKDPRSFYKLTGNSPIVFIVMNLTLDLAYTGLYSLIVENIKQSPWFCERVTIRGKYDFTIEFGKGISLMAGSNVQHSIGKNVLGAVLDEVNFSKAPKGSKNSVMDLYRNIRRRMESRFMKQGIMPGFLIMVSSKNSELDFLEQYLNSVRHSNKILIVDEPVYKIKPPETYLGPTFKVAVGDKTKDSFIIKDDNDESRATDYNYRVIEVPVEYRPAFEGDINESLREIAGITVFNSNKLIPYPKRILQCVDETRRSPFFQETIFLDLNTDDEVIDYLDGIKSLRSIDPTRPRFIHVDIGLKGDCLGLTAVHVSKKTLVSRVNEEGTTIDVQENVYYQDLSLRVSANQGSEIPLYKIREFIIWMRKNLWKIAKVTYDGFQSADSIQLLRTAGFDTGLLSVDRSDVPYLTLRSAILDNRVQLYRHDTLLRELEELEYDRTHRKVDHPIISIDNRPGSKDVADSLCGAVYDAQEYYSVKDPMKNLVRKDTLKTQMNVLAQLKNDKPLSVKEEMQRVDWLLGD